MMAQRIQWRRFLVVVLLPALLVVLMTAFYGAARSEGNGTTPFTDVTDAAGIQWPHYKQKDYHAVGQAWGDYNLDGWLDLYVTGQLTDTNMLFEAVGDGTFVQSPYSTTVLLPQPSGGASFSDYDNDGDKDLYVANNGPNVLFRNDGDGFTDVTASAGVGDEGKGSTTSWGDYDNDGWLDLYVSNWWHDDCKATNTFDCPQNSDRLYHNNGDGTFSDATSALTQQHITSTLGLGFSASFVDYDNDGDLDIYLVNDQFTPAFGNTNGNHLWRNDGDPELNGCADPNWCFTEVTEESGTDYLLCGMGLATGDYDQDGDLDFYFSNAGFCGEGGTHHLLQNQTSQGSPTFVDVTSAAGVGFDHVGWGTIFFDYDNDTWLDLYVASGDVENPLYHNNGDGTFTDVTSTSGANDPGPSRGVAYADYNSDGWVDMVTSNRDGGPIGHHLYQNQSYLTYPNNHWLTVQLTGDGDAVNLDAVGTRVYLDLGDGRVHMQELKNGSALGSGNSLALHFGLGELPAETSTIPSVTIEWPDGSNDELLDVAVDQVLNISQPVQTPVNALIYVSLSNSGSVGGVDYGPEDILLYEVATGTWSMFFDGSDVGLPQNINAFTFLDDGSALISMEITDVVPGIQQTVFNSDIIRFVPTSYGDTTAGTFEMYFDGSDYELDSFQENIDAISINPDGWLAISTIGPFSVTGLNADDEDLVRFDINGSQVWNGYFDGSDVGLHDTNDEDIQGAWIDPNTELFYLTTLGDFNVIGATGDGLDVFTCEASSTGADTACTFSPFWDGSAAGLSAGYVDGIAIGQSAITPFLDVTDAAGIQWPHYKQKDYHAVGQAWGDYNQDGYLDLYVTGQLTGTNMLFEAVGDGSFVQSPYSTTVLLPQPSGGTSFADYDNDGDPDLYVGNNGANVLFRNDGNGFTDVTAAAGVGDTGKTSTVSWGDYDEDGWLDLYVANWWHDDCKATTTFDCPQNSDRLYHNNGDGTFSDITSSLNQQYITATLGLGFVASFVDYDNDGDPDIYLVNDQFTPEFGNTNHNHLWRNDGSPAEGGCGDPNWCWTEVSESTGTDYLLCGMGLATGDYDKDGDLDFYFSNAGFCGEGGTHHLLQNQTSQGSPTFVDVTIPAGVDFNQVGWGTIFSDYNNDSWLDLYVASGNAENPLYRNNGNGTFTDVTAISGANDAGPSRGVAYADYNNDGWVDMVTSNRDGGEIGHHLYMNQAQLEYPDNRWLTVKLTGDGKVVNRDAVGARVYLNLDDGLVHMQELKDGSSFGAGNTLALHFGLGQIVTDTVPSLDVVWPNGTRQTFYNVPTNQVFQASFPIYREVTDIVGLAPNHALGSTCTPPIGSGSAWGDYDNDGDIDLFITNRGGANWLYRNDGDTNGDGLPDYTDVAAALGVADATVASHGAVFVDYDNDGDQDLYVTAWEQTKMYQNQLAETGVVSFVDVTAAAGIGDDGRPVTAAWGDFDQDGYLDLYIAKHKHCSADDPPLSQDHLFHNNGDGTFTDVTSWLCGGDPSTCAQVNGLGFAPGWFDYDNDGDPDLYLSNDNILQSFYHNVLWRNDGPDGSGGWLFTDVSSAAGADQSINAMGLGIGDYNNDGWQDLAFSNIGENYLLKNNGDGTFADVTVAAGVDRPTLPGTGNDSITWGTAFFDYNNDSLLDLYMVAGYINELNDLIQPNAFFQNNGDGTFDDISAVSGLADPDRGRSASIVDFDEDGFVDVFVGNYGVPARLFHNESMADGTNNWLRVTVEGTVSNRDGIGTRLWLATPDGVTQLREISSGPTHGGGDYRAAYFGMSGNITGTLTVRWPTGVVEVVGEVGANQALHLVEGGQVAHALEISKSGPATALPQQRISYTIVVTHEHESLPTDNVIVTDQLPADTLLVSSDHPFTFDGTTVTWNLGTMTANETISIELTVEMPAVTEATLVTNSVYGASSNDVATVSGPPVETWVAPAAGPPTYLYYVPIIHKP